MLLTFITCEKVFVPIAGVTANNYSCPSTSLWGLQRNLGEEDASGQDSLENLTPT